MNLSDGKLIGFAVAALWPMHPLCVQIEHRTQQLFLVKAVAHQIEPRLARRAVCFQERVVRVGIEDQLRFVHRSSFPQTKGR